MYSVREREIKGRSKVSNLDNWKDSDAIKRGWGRRIKRSRFQQEGDKFSFK